MMVGNTWKPKHLTYFLLIEAKSAIMFSTRVLVVEVDRLSDLADRIASLIARAPSPSDRPRAKPAGRPGCSMRVQCARFAGS